MGIIAGALFTGGIMTKQDFAANWGQLHWPIILSAHAAIAMGTYFGGWRIVHTMGSKITKLKPLGGFCAETAGAVTLFGTALAGIPVSTTHTITGAIVGVGATTRLSAVRWGVARRIVWAWVLTIPASAAVAAATFVLIRLFYRGA
jgi:PiT family inorganic phosphate transporter